MTKIFSALLLGLLFISSCQDYVSSKREGLKPFHGEGDERQAEESNGSKD